MKCPSCGVGNWNVYGPFDYRAVLFCVFGWTWRRHLHVTCSCCARRWCA